MTIKEFKAGQSIYEFNEDKKDYFIIIRGKVQFI